MKPIEISAERANKILTIQWADGRRCRYPFALLRKVCPCAECRGDEKPPSQPPAGEMDIPLLELPVVDGRSTMVRELELVGNYALNITWGDGHHFGIYNWGYLRNLCEQLQDGLEGVEEPA